MKFYGWKLEKDGKTITEYVTTEAKNIEVGFSANVMPKWITDHPTVEDFHRWQNRIPGRNNYDYLLDDRFDRMDDRMIVAILEKEGTIGYGSYTRPRAYGKAWTVSVGMDEQERGMARKRQNNEQSWSFPQSIPSSTGDWKRSVKHPSTDQEE